MKRAMIIKSAVCIGATAFMLTGFHAPRAYAAGGVCTETSLAGLTLSLENYANVAEAEAEAKEEKQETKKEKKEEAKKESKYAKLGISIANDYVHIRKKPNTDSKIVGKLYRGSAAEITAKKGDWVKIKSGSVSGYIKSEYLAIGYDAEEVENMFGTKWATVNTTTLKVREKKSTDSTVLCLIPIEDTFEVIKEYDNWVKILIDGDGDESTKGYVSKSYVDLDVEFEEAISIKEEEEKLRKEEEARQAEAERLRQLAEEQQRQQEQQQQQEQNSGSSSSGSSNSSGSGSSSSSNSNSGSSSSTSNSSSSSNSNSSSSSSNSSSSNSSSGSSSSNSNSGSSSSDSSSSSSSSSGAADQPTVSGNGSDIAAYAQNFVGNPYVYGGTSLTNGADCSGFVMSVFQHFGISLPRTSSAQAGAGRKVSFDSLQAGDLILYASNGRVSHVALYIGGGQVVHASSPKTGIKISTWNYRTPYTARRIVE